MNSKLILAIAAIIVVGGGIFAVRSLTNTATVVETTDGRADEDIELTSADASNDDDVAARISAVQRGDRTPRSGSGRTFNRGEGAAAIDVTPATTTSEQMAALAAGTPESTGTTNIEESRQIADLVNLFRNQTDPEERVDIADELGMIDNPEAIRSALELLKGEQDPLVQAALLEAMQALEALEETAPEVLQSTKALYANTEDPDVKIAAQDLLGDIANQEAATTLKQWRETDDPVLRLNATEDLMRVWATDPDLVTPEEVEMYNGQLQQEYEAGPDAAYRSQAIMGLAINGSENVEFFQTALIGEQDQQVRQLLERLINMYTNPSPTAPPAGTVITPAPTPLVAE